VKSLIKGILPFSFFYSWGYKKVPKGTHFVRAKSGVLMFHINSPWVDLFSLKYMDEWFMPSRNNRFEILTIFFNLV